MAAFTLIELIVSIAIITLLLAISIPAMAGVRDSGRRVKCASNLKQIGTLTEIGMQNFGGVFPYFIPGMPESRDAGRITMEQAFEGVADDFRVWICPANPDEDDVAWWTSYDYYPGQEMDNDQLLGGMGAVREVSFRYLNATKGGVWGDRRPWHGRRKSNIVWYPDWSVSRF